MKIKITDSATNTELYRDEKHLHSDDIAFSTMWVDPYSAPATLKVESDIIIDYNTEPEKRYVTFYSQP